MKATKWYYTNGNNDEYFDIEGDYRICSINATPEILAELEISKEEVEENAKLIVEAVNNYHSLKEENERLRSIAKRCAFIFGNENNYPEGTTGYQIAQDAKEALK